MKDPDTLNFNRIRKIMHQLEISEIMYFLDIVEAVIFEEKCGFSDTKQAFNTMRRLREIVKNKGEEYE
jgi:uncharacterized protein YktA (UPF0223 family)